MCFKKKIGAYMTLEAAFIIPWVVFILVWLIYLGYFEYNRCIVFQDNYMIASQASVKINTEEVVRSWMEEHVGGDRWIKYIGDKKHSASWELSTKKISVNSSISVAHPLFFHEGMIPDSNWNITDKVEINRYSFTEKIRLYRIVGRLME